MFDVPSCIQICCPQLVVGNSFLFSCSSLAAPFNDHNKELYQQFSAKGLLVWDSIRYKRNPCHHYGELPIGLRFHGKFIYDYLKAIENLANDTEGG
jgi:hypothetical protein